VKYGDIRMTAENLHRVPNPLKLLLFEDPSGVYENVITIKALLP